MPQLKCTVETCIHNKANFCDMGHIDISGGVALSKCETACSSFKDYALDSYTNSFKGASATADIACGACNCQYNEASTCQAGYVEVQGSNACQSTDTECASFVYQIL